MVKNLLITGGAGFIASNYLYYWAKNHPNDNLIVIDDLTYAGNISNIQELITSSKIIFKKGNINNKNFVYNLLKNYSINNIVHMAAESHVDRSINSPELFLNTNIIGTFNLLECFRNHWNENNNPSDWRFHHISTDEVYGSLDLNDPKFNEKTPYSPRSPYSASKAASDHMVLSWFHTYGLPILISNCSNNYGPYQFPEKLIPLTILNCLNKTKIPIYGKGENMRDWLFVSDHIKALELILLNAEPGKQYCIGGGNEVSNINLVKLICELFDKSSSKKINSKSVDLIEYVQDRPGHDFRYSIDYKLIKKELNWSPSIDLNTGIKSTIKWYLHHKSFLYSSFK